MNTPLARLRTIGIAEGISFLTLLGIAMPLKYLAGQPGPVKVVGMIHGVLFLVYLLSVLEVWHTQRWPFLRAVIAAGASVVPFGPFLLEAHLRREAQTAQASSSSSGQA